MLQNVTVYILPVQELDWHSLNVDVEGQRVAVLGQVHPLQGQRPHLAPQGQPGWQLKVSLPWQFGPSGFRSLWSNKRFADLDQDCIKSEFRFLKFGSKESLLKSCLKGKYFRFNCILFCLRAFKAKSLLTLAVAPKCIDNSYSSDNKL